MAKNNTSNILTVFCNFFAEILKQWKMCRFSPQLNIGHGKQLLAPFCVVLWNIWRAKFPFLKIESYQQTKIFPWLPLQSTSKVTQLFVCNYWTKRYYFDLQFVWAKPLSFWYVHVYLGIVLSRWEINTDEKMSSVITCCVSKPVAKHNMSMM